MANALISEKRVWPVWPTLLVSLAMTPWAGADPANETGRPSPTGIEVHVRDGLLTLNADGAPLGDVVRAIGDQAGFDIVIEGTVDSPVRRSFVGVPVESALRHLLDDVPHVTFYASPEAGESRRRPLEVRLYGWDPPARARSVATDPAALAKLFGPERDPRIQTIRELARARDPLAVLPLGRVLEQDADPRVRGQAAGALGAIGAASALPALQAALDDSAQLVRMRAIRALAEIESEEATRALGDVLLDGLERRSRLMAAWALGRQGGPMAQSYLEIALQDPDELVRRSVDRALSQAQVSAGERDPMAPHDGGEHAFP